MATNVSLIVAGLLVLASLALTVWTSLSHPELDDPDDEVDPDHEVDPEDREPVASSALDAAAVAAAVAATPEE